MTVISKTKNSVRSTVYHREYKNNLPKKEDIRGGAFSQCLRITQVVLPFISLYKPLGKPLSIVLGTTRVISSTSQMLNAISSKDSQATGEATIETAIATTALVCSILTHPLGMLVTMSHDMIVNVTQLVQAIQVKDYKKATEIGVHLTNNVLYLGGASSLARQSYRLLRSECRFFSVFATHATSSRRATT